MSVEDRRVHAVLSDGTEVVRYDRAGKWYLEKDGVIEDDPTLALDEGFMIGWFANAMETVNQRRHEVGLGALDGRLFFEQECEHGEVGAHWNPDVPPVDFGRPGPNAECPGGERREVVVDYEAAVKLDWKIYDEAMSVQDRAAQIRLIVDAALGLTEEGH